MRDAESGRNLLVSLKATAGLPGPSVLIPICSPPIAFLRPVATKRALLNPEDIRSLTDWRNRFVHSFLTEFLATYERTARWLVEVVGPNEGKILFMLDDIDGRTFGYTGLGYMDWEEGYGEADSLVRGGEGPPDVMKHAFHTMMSWAQGQLGLRQLGGRVRSDNRALSFFEKVGYQAFRRVPLRRVEEPDMVRWVEDESLKDGTLYLVHMLWPDEIQDLNDDTLN